MTSHVAVQTASRNQRSWVTTSSEPRRAARWRASQSTPSTSRWFVGSSSSSSSGPSRSVRASAIRRRSPPDSVPMRVSRPSGNRRHRDAAEQAVEHRAERRVARPLVVRAAADELLADGARGIEVVALPEQREAACRACAVSAPASGSSRPAMSRSSVDLPSPLRPTTPIRSPAATPSVTSCRTVRAAYPFPTPLRLTRLRAIARSYAGPMIQLAFITQGNSQYADRLWKLLEGTGIDPHEFEGLDYYGLVPFFVLSGGPGPAPGAHARRARPHRGRVRGGRGGARGGLLRDAPRDPRHGLRRRRR